MIALQAGGTVNMLFLLAMVVVFIFFIIIPQFRRQKELKKFRSELKKGDHVVTTGGIMGRVSDISDNAVTIVSDEKTKIKVAKQALVKDVNSVSQAR